MSTSGLVSCKNYNKFTLWREDQTFSFVILKFATNVFHFVMKISHVVAEVQPQNFLNFSVCSWELNALSFSNKLQWMWARNFESNNENAAMKVKGDGWWGVMYKLKCLLHVILGHCLAFFNYYFRFVFHFAVHWLLSESWSQNCVIWCATTGG